jgi:hypothetical protein
VKINHSAIRHQQITTAEAAEEPLIEAKKPVSTPLPSEPVIISVPV